MRRKVFTGKKAPIARDALNRRRAPTSPGTASLETVMASIEATQRELAHPALRRVDRVKVAQRLNLLRALAGMDPL